MGSWELGFINSPPESGKTIFGDKVTYYKVPFPVPVNGLVSDCGLGNKLWMGYRVRPQLENKVEMRQAHTASPSGSFTPSALTALDAALTGNLQVHIFPGLMCGLQYPVSASGYSEELDPRHRCYPAGPLPQKDPTLSPIVLLFCSTLSPQQLCVGLSCPLGAWALHPSGWAP